MICFRETKQLRDIADGAGKRLDKMFAGSERIRVFGGLLLDMLGISLRFLAYAVPIFGAGLIITLLLCHWGWLR